MLHFKLDTSLGVAPDLLNTWLDGVDELPLTAMLAHVGVTASCSAAAKHPHLGAVIHNNGSLHTVWDHGSAQAAGLQTGDVLISLDGRVIKTVAHLTEVLQTHTAGEVLTVQYQRDGRLRQTQIALAAAPQDTWTFTLNEQADTAAVARRKAWLGV